MQGTVIVRLKLAQNGQSIRFSYFVHSLLADTVVSSWQRLT